MQVVPNVAMVETYARLLLIAPHSLFRSHLSVTSFTQQKLNGSVKMFNFFVTHCSVFNFFVTHSGRTLVNLLSWDVLKILEITRG